MFKYVVLLALVAVVLADTQPKAAEDSKDLKTASAYGLGYYGGYYGGYPGYGINAYNPYYRGYAGRSLWGGAYPYATPYAYNPAIYNPAVYNPYGSSAWW